MNMMAIKMMKYARGDAVDMECCMETTKGKIRDDYKNCRKVNLCIMPGNI